MRGRAYIVLFTLALIWGASFLFIALAVREVSPATLVAVRLGSSVVTLGAIVAARPKLFAGWWRFWRLSVWVGVINYVIPYLLIAWGETRISSGMASILNATTPLFTVVLANWWVSPGHEELTLRRGFGAIVGFVGVAVLVGPQVWSASGSTRASLFGLLAVLVAAAAYAVGTLLSRSYAGSAQLVGPLGSQIAAFIILVPIALFWNSWITVRISPAFALGWHPPTHLPSPLAIASMLELGVAATAVAFLLYFWLIRNVGATRTSLVTYLLPCTALIWGALILGETVTWYALVGLGLVLVGTMITNGTLNFLLARRARATTLPAPASEAAMRETATRS